jgi:hypothetical protein
MTTRQMPEGHEAGSPRQIIDLYDVYQQRLRNGAIALHPHRWLKSKVSHRSLADWRFQSLLAALTSSGRAPRSLCIAGTPVLSARKLRAALEHCGHRSESGIYCADPAVAAVYARHVPIGSAIQDGMKDRLKERFRSLTFEVATPVGRIDCLTTTTLYEVAHIRSWMRALGQIIAYSHYVNRRFRVMYLYGSEVEPKQLVEARKVSHREGVRVHYVKCRIPTVAELSSTPCLVDCVA